MTLVIKNIVGKTAAAIILAIYVFKRTIDFKAYRELDLNYIEVLKVDIENPYLRDPRWASKHSVQPRDWFCFLSF
jgi:hypothetical protein